MKMENGFPTDDEVMKVYDDHLAKSKEAASKYSELDAPILNKPKEKLCKLYRELFFNIVTDELFKKVEDCTARQRWKMVEPFTWFNDTWFNE